MPKKLKEDAPVNATGGAVAGYDPLMKKTPMKRFAGNPVFVVPSDKYHKCIKGKLRYHRYESYVGNDEVGEEIRSYGRTNEGCIMVEDEKTGHMCVLRYGKRK